MGVIGPRDAVWQENALHKGISGLKRNCLALITVISYLGEDVSLVVRKIVVTVNYSHGIVELQTELETKSAPIIIFALLIYLKF